MMCGDSSEEKHKRVEVVVDHGGTKVIGKTTIVKNKSTNVKKSWSFPRKGHS